jgi:uncharacterized lipoprotein YddW (UPF0748 family)/N-acetylmuramoyl-L-alanine amidase
MTSGKLRLIIPLLLAAVMILSGCGQIISTFGHIYSGAEEVPASEAPRQDEASPSPENGTDTGPSNGATEGEKEAFRGIWVSTVINLDYPSRPGLPVSELKAEAIEILDNIEKMGFNAVILQVRPAGDAFYKSELFPWSEYLTGTQGLAPGDGFDPLEFWVEQAHARGLELHAWINPYRVARLTHDLETLSPDNYAYKHPEWVIKHTDGHMYYNPGIPAVRSLIIDGVTEIVENYDVDGIHFDDYFYPDGKFGDEETYLKYGKDFSNRDDWRRNNIDKLVEETYSAIKAIDPNVRFGISPFGIWANKSSNSLGSDTNGNQSYYSHFADTRKWVLNGWLDYICPQIYWNIGYRIADYEVLLNWWIDAVSGTDVDLYIGHASYRSGDSNPDSAWYGTAEIRRQLELNASRPEVDGSVHFRYKFFITYPALASFIIEQHYGPAELADYPGMEKPESDGGINLGRPAKDITTTFSKMYVIGTCDPDQTLFLNGRAVEGVTESGYFGVLVELEEGENILEFVQEEASLIRKIHRSVPQPSAEPVKKNVAEIIDGSTYPHNYDVYIMPGEKITFRCTAPIGATVNVTIAGNTYKLYPATTKKPGDDAVYYTRFSYTYTMPKTDKTGKVLVIGTPVYKMTYKGKTVTKTATAGLKCITPGAPYYAKVIKDYAFLYEKSSTSGGPIGELKAGMTDYITAVTTSGSWVRLGLGGWVLSSDVERFEGKGPLAVEISGTEYVVGEKWDCVRFTVNGNPAAKVSLEDSKLTLVISGVNKLEPIKLIPGGMMSAYSSSIEEGNAVYRLTLDKNVKLDGYYIDTEYPADNSGTGFETPGTLSLYLKRRPGVSGSIDKPLDGIVVMLDAGHGNADAGALGPLGLGLPEKDIALRTAMKVKYELERLGAEVLMTRTGDDTVTLEQRLDMSREAKPDLFLAIHNNAVEVNVDATSIVGISTWYMRSISYEAASDIVNYIASDLGRVHRKANQASLYVCRGFWVPSLILETGFICSPSEYEWLSDNEMQTELAKSIARAVVHYFGS